MLQTLDIIGKMNGFLSKWMWEKCFFGKYNRSSKALNWPDILQSYIVIAHEKMSLIQLAKNPVNNMTYSFNVELNDRLTIQFF